MIYTIFLLTLFSVFLIVRSYKNRYAWLLVMMVIGLNLIFLGIILNVVKGGTYKYPENALFFLDYKMYLYLSSLKINYYDTFRLQNWGTAVYLFSIPQFVFTFIVSSYRSSGRFSKWLRYVAFALPPLFYVWCYDPDTRFLAYIWIKDPFYRNHDLSAALYGMDALNLVWVALYLFYPIYLLCRHMARTSITLKRKQIVSLAANLGLMNVLFVSVFAVGPFKQFYLSAGGSNMLFFPAQLAIPAFYFQVMPAVMLLAVQGMIVILVKFKGIDATSFFMKRQINRNVSSLNANLKGVFHSFKNTMFTVKILAEQAENNFGNEDGLKALRRLQQVSLTSLNHMAKVLDSLKEIKVKPAKVNVSACADAAFEKARIGDDIEVRRKYRARDVYAYADPYHLTEALINLLVNAAEAIKAAKRENGFISIEIAAEQEWVLIRITDNGTGIDKKEQKKIFNPLYSTKSKHENWGVGLSYVFRVIEAHLGFIAVESEKGQYTAFDVILPIAGAGRGDGKWKKSASS
ncbi:sensor histidine kinase [Paenibacillus germinis]|uniref:sensor histidine kinase n=1 Tax=Paenibacillus germinis TaxID=2654979 RepID=UPI0014927B6D|nr:HAMP domain-containing sensor histidine kinase [Paenibacillus germinis]